MTAKPFVYLKDCKIKRRLAVNGEESWLECSVFTEDNTLVIFNVSIVDTGNEKILTVKERQRRQDWQLNLQTTSRAKPVAVWGLAERSIADRMADLNQKLAPVVFKSTTEVPK